MAKSNPSCQSYERVSPHEVALARPRRLGYPAQCDDPGANRGHTRDFGSGGCLRRTPPNCDERLPFQGGRSPVRSRTVSHPFTEGNLSSIFVRAALDMIGGDE